MNKKLLYLFSLILSSSIVSADGVSDTNEKIMGAISGIGVKGILNFLGWLLVIILLAGAGYWYFAIYSKNKKIFSKKIVAKQMIGGYWKPVYYDVAKSVKLGKAGFEVLYLKKLKTWKIAYGGNFGDSEYEFYIMPDGYWFNSRAYGDVKYMDNNAGLVSVVTTNPLMRGQYVALEKQVDALHAEKGKWWDKYSTVVLSIAFVLIAGVIMWLLFKEWRGAVEGVNMISDKQGILLDKISNLISNIQGTSGGNSGLIPA